MRIFGIKPPRRREDFAATLDGFPDSNLQLSGSATPGAGYRVESSFDLGLWTGDPVGLCVGDSSGFSSVTVSHVEGGILPVRSSCSILVLGRLWVERVA